MAGRAGGLTGQSGQQSLQTQPVTSVSNISVDCLVTNRIVVTMYNAVGCYLDRFAQHVDESVRGERPATTGDSVESESVQFSFLSRCNLCRSSGCVTGPMQPG